MSQRIRSLVPKPCPACGAVGRFASIQGQMTCQACGYSPQTAARPSSESRNQPTSGDPSASKTTAEIKQIKPRLKSRPAAAPQANAPAPAPQAKTPPKPGEYSEEHLARLRAIKITEGLIHPEPVTTWVGAFYSTGLQHVRRQEWAEAVASFKRTVDEDRYFVDGHLWLARLSQDPKDEREHLSVVLAMIPTHAEAIARLMVLNGQLSEAEAARAINPDAAPAVHEVQEPVTANAKLMKCPNCGGRMKAGEDGKSLVCEFCGHTEARMKAQDYGFKSFSMEMLKQRAQPVKWVVGDRLLKCQTCGAERTLMHGQISGLCFFCGSSYVVQTDVLDSFQQPDGIIPFEVTQKEAEDALQKALNSTFERFKGWFVNNEADNARLEALYLPYWLFDFTVDIRTTITARQIEGFTRESRSTSPGLLSRTETITEIIPDVPVLATTDRDSRLIRQASTFLFEQIQPYDPDLLASHSALIYRIPFDKAVLDARQEVADKMRSRHDRQTFDSEIRVNGILVRQIMFRLVLMPFWTVTIREKDGDVRPALINGQTGEVALGKARKPRA